MGLAKHYGHKHGGRETEPALDPHRLLDQTVELVNMRL